MVRPLFMYGRRTSIIKIRSPAAAPAKSRRNGKLTSEVTIPISFHILLSRFIQCITLD